MQKKMDQQCHCEGAVGDCGNLNPHNTKTVYFLRSPPWRTKQSNQDLLTTNKTDFSLRPQYLYEERAEVFWLAINKGPPCLTQAFFLGTFFTENNREIMTKQQRWERISNIKPRQISSGQARNKGRRSKKSVVKGA